MSTEETRALVHRYYEEIVNGGNSALVDELFSPDYVNHVPGSPSEHQYRSNTVAVCLEEGRRTKGRGTIYRAPSFRRRWYRAYLKGIASSSPVA